MEARLNIDVRCPDCGLFMSGEWGKTDTVKCTNTHCSLYLIPFEYKSPTVTLKRVSPEPDVVEKPELKVTYETVDEAIINVINREGTYIPKGAKILSMRFQC